MRRLLLLLAWLIAYTTCPAAESVQVKELRFLKRHQSPDGSWNPLTYADQCTDRAPRCEPGLGGPDDVIALTAQAIECFLAHAYDHQRPSAYRTTVQQGLTWLLAQEKDPGVFGTTVETQALATCVLGDAHDSTNDPSLKEPAQRALNRLLAMRLPGADGKPLAWGDPKTGVFNTAQTFDAFMAVHMAQRTGLTFGDSVERLKLWWDSAWKAGNPHWETLTDPYIGRSTFPAQWSAATGAVGEDIAAGTLTAIWTGHHPGDLALETLANALVAQYLPNGNDLPTDLRALKNGTYALFQCSYERWKQWRAGLFATMNKHQRSENTCFDGSFDPDLQTYSHTGRGRLQSTIYMTLALESLFWGRPPLREREPPAP